MEDFIRDCLIDDEKLLKAYEIAEAKYLLSLNENYVRTDVNFDLDNDEMKTFIRTLAKYKMCFDEWVLFKLKDTLIQKEMEKTNEKTSKHTDDNKN